MARTSTVVRSASTRRHHVARARALAASAARVPAVVEASRRVRQAAATAAVVAATRHVRRAAAVLVIAARGAVAAAVASVIGDLAAVRDQGHRRRSATDAAPIAGALADRAAPKAAAKGPAVTGRAAPAGHQRSVPTRKAAVAAVA